MGDPPGQSQLPTTAQDFRQPGTQPNQNPDEFAPVIQSANCTFCHSDYDSESAPFDTWISSMMAQSARDPVWHAALAIANQDAHLSGETCIRCHAPAAWLGGRSAGARIEDFLHDDFDGINCHFCHRVVNPELGPHSAVGYAEAGQDPDPDPEVVNPLASAGLLPDGHGNARFVVDPKDVRRGPFPDVPMNLHGLDSGGEPAWLITSPFHSRSEFCGTCHDVSNPVFSKNATGQYALNGLNAPHPTQRPSDMFPEQRTYSEWKNSQFASTGVEYPDGRFGGALIGPMRSCQDCHMPDQVGAGCVFAEFGDPPWFRRPNLPQHSFAGSNTWVIDAVRHQLGDAQAETIGLTMPRVEAAKARNLQMLRDASDLELATVGARLRVRVVNQTGHKLPTGYPEGRRMWVNVRFIDAVGAVVAEHGRYDHAEARITGLSTKVYEAKHGTDAAVEAATGVPAGENFHLALANVRYRDNRIPPRGFTNAAFEADGCAPVGQQYADGQHWDDTLFDIPPAARQAVVTVYFQTSSREYIEFLRDENRTNAAGQIVHALWTMFGRSAPVVMDAASIPLPPRRPADITGDGLVNGDDLGALVVAWGPAQGSPADLDGNGMVNGDDLGMLLIDWG